MQEGCILYSMVVEMVSFMLTTVVAKYFHLILLNYY